MTEPHKYEQHYTARGFSPRYGREIDELAEWFREKLPGVMDDLVITKAIRERGVDALPDEVQEVTREAFRLRLQAGWELSYNQTCVAFFDAIDSLGILTH